MRDTIWTLIRNILKNLPENQSHIIWKGILRIRRLFLIFLINFGFSNSRKRMDQKIVKLFNSKRNGFFIEVGAADGVDTSNTFLLEKKYNWRGLLIEPIKEYYYPCKKIRKKSIVVNYCLTNNLIKNPQSKMIKEDLKSKIINDEDSIGPSRNFEINPIEFIENTTLSNLLEKHSIKNVDIMSLDVEYHEIEVLKGYKSSSQIINYLLVETLFIEKFKKYASERGWEYIEQWNNDDYLFKLRKDSE